MGDGFGVKCGKCGYEFDAFLGIGMLALTEHEKYVKKMKAGKLGPEGKKFFEDYPTGVVNTEHAIAKCSSCGNYDDVYDLTMYIPYKNKEHLADKYGCIMESDIRGNYKKYMDYPHKCSACGGSSRVLKEFEKEASEGVLKCPKCDGYMKKILESYILWD